MITTPTKIFLEIHFKFEKDSFFLIHLELKRQIRFYSKTIPDSIPKQPKQQTIYTHLGRLIYTYETYIAYGYLWVSQEHLQGSVNNPAKYQKTCYFLYPHLYKAKPITRFGKVIGFWSWKPLSGFKIFNLRPWTGWAFRPAILRFPPG